MEFTIIGVGKFRMTEQHVYEEQLHQSATVQYHVYPAETLAEVASLNELETLVLQAVESNAPALWRGLYQDVIEIEKRLTDTSWIFSVDYKKNTTTQRSPAPDYSRAIENWDFTGEMKTLVRALEVMDSYGPTGSAPDRGGFIGYDGEKISGVQVPYGAAKLSLRFLKLGSEMPMSYKRSVNNLYYNTNTADWRGFNAGELLFTGGSMSEREDGDFDITFNFKPDKERTFSNFSGFISSSITVPPHHYLDCSYAPKEITIGSVKDVIEQAKYAYVCRVYEKGDFAALAIP